MEDNQFNVNFYGNTVRVEIDTDDYTDDDGKQTIITDEDIFPKIFEDLSSETGINVQTQDENVEFELNKDFDDLKVGDKVSGSMSLDPSFIEGNTSVFEGEADIELDTEELMPIKVNETLGVKVNSYEIEDGTFKFTGDVVDYTDTDQESNRLELERELSIDSD